jgi:nicotinamidase-related amidase
MVMPALDLAKSALAVIDMQCYFLEEDADAYLGAPKRLVTNVLELVGAFRGAAKPIVFTRHAHAKGSDTGEMGRWWDGKLPWEGDRQSDLIDDLEPSSGERIITKVRYSAFEGTDLDAWLRERSVDTLVVCGVMTNLCVETTARHAFMKDIQPVIVEDACASSDSNYHKASIMNLGYGFAHIESTDSIRKILKGAKR